MFSIASFHTAPKRRVEDDRRHVSKFHMQLYDLASEFTLLNVAP